MKEIELAKRVIAYLEDHKWDVYQEVQSRQFGKVADIVAVQNNVVWIIECKTNFGLKVLEQANNWYGYANYISIATPPNKTNKFIEDFMIYKGIGHISITEYDYYEKIKPYLNRKAYTKKVLSILNEKHKTFAEAGNNERKHFTPFQNTVLEIQRVVKNKQGILFNDLIKEINHHYKTSSTAKSCLKQWIETGVIKNIFIRKEDNLLRVYYDK